MGKRVGLWPSVDCTCLVYLIETHLYLRFSLKIIKRTVLRTCIQTRFDPILDINFDELLAEQLAVWELGEQIPESIPGRTKLETNFSKFVHVCSF